MFVPVFRSRSVIDDIGTIEYDPARTVTVLRIDYMNDYRPEFKITSLTVGYPTLAVANQLLPPYLMKAQVMRAHVGFPSGK
jgi:ribosomal protein L2